MKTIYLECAMGAAGDMLMAALLELHPQPQDFLRRLNGLGLPGVSVAASPVSKCGVEGTHIDVTVKGQVEVSEDVTGAEDGVCSHGGEMSHGHSHHREARGLSGIDDLLLSLPLPEQVREDARAVYRLIASAEAEVHGCEVTQVHFHEVGALDAVADVVGVCLLVHELGAEQILASPVHVGCGQVRCAHGILPVPAPATEVLLRGIPIYGGRIQGELCTPTGAALLKYFVRSFGELPSLRLQKTGYGMGKKDFPQLNCVRALLGETEETETIAELVCNLDDMTPEEVGFAVGKLMQEGALDVYTTPIQMKKNRPAVLLTCMCRESQRDKFLHLLFLHTTTLGVREYSCRRYRLHRQERREQTPYGEVGIKTAQGYGVCREKAEYEDLARIAQERGLSLRQVREMLEKAGEGGGKTP